MTNFIVAGQRFLGGLIASAVVAVALVGVGSAPPAVALAGSDWVPGNIISDSLFYDANAMSQGEIQAFLNARIRSCATSDCLNVLQYTVKPRERQSSSLTGQVICEPLPGGKMSAAALIFAAQSSCGISAKVILVILQKEQSLITGSFARAPSQYALDRAMGMACPDRAPCAAYALGFGNQIYEGARQLKVYKAGRFGRQPGVQSIEFSPTPSCGASVINVQNYATAALYNYTPYQPNAAALTDLYGSGNDCSSYGNRNFWRDYTAWFGSTQGLPSPDVAPALIARDASGYLVMYLGTGKGNWQPAKTIGNGWSSMTAILGAGDFDGDAHRDVLARDASGNLWNYPMLDDGTFGARKLVSGGWGSMVDVLAGQDVNGDGIQDIVARDGAGALWLYAGSGRGKLRPPIQIGNGWAGFTALLQVGDFTGDGIADLVARDSGGTLWLYPGVGGGRLGSRLQIGTGWGSMSEISAPGDFGGDGTADIIARTASGSLYLYSGNGRGGIWRALPIGYGWGGMTAITGAGAPIGRVFTESQGVGDLDTDGARDVLAIAPDGTASVYRGDGRGGWRGTATAGDGWGSIVDFSGVGDVDGDGIPDVVARDSGGSLWLYPGTGTGTGAGAFGPRRQIGSGWGAYTALIGAGDVTGDGIPDLLARDAAGALILFSGTGESGYAVGRQVGNGWNAMTAIVNAGDVDGDGNPDILARDAAGALWLYSGNGNGGWFPPRQIGVGWGSMTDLVAPGDFTGDQQPDLLGRDTSGRLWLFVGDGSGGFAAVRQIGSGWSGMRLIG